MKQSREIALENFLQKRKNKKGVIGAIVCGSYITGNPSKHSDIDIHIIMDEKITRREKGNEIIDGILIEYFINPIRKLQEHMEEDFKKRSKLTAHMLATGKILFDSTGKIQKLKQEGEKYLTKKYIKLSTIQIELLKYHLWDSLDNLEEIYETQGEEFTFAFHNYLHKLFETYANFLQFGDVPIHKTKRFLTDEKDKKKYRINNFPDTKFATLFVQAITSKSKKEQIKIYTELTNHVLKKMG